MLSSLLLLLQVATVPPTPAPRSEIVVTGVKLSTLKDDLDRCIAEKCPPRADIIASVRYAEGLFRSGAYVDAKKVLVRSIGRNKGAGAADSLAVSELYLATANVALHEGDRDLARTATYRRVEVLRASQETDRPALLAAEMSVADMALKTGDPKTADRLYANLTDRVAGQPRLLAALALRRANLASANGHPERAQALLDPVFALPGADLSGYRLAARVLAARAATQRGDRKAIDRALAAIAAEPAQTAPVLLSSPAIAPPADADALGSVEVMGYTLPVRKPGSVVTLGWADVGFWVRSDGKVEGVDVLRGSKGQAWTATVVQSVAGRIYASFGEAGGGQYRIERFTLTADYGTPVGSTARVRSFNPRIEQLDITGGAPPPVAAG